MTSKDEQDPKVDALRRDDSIDNVVSTTSTFGSSDDSPKLETDEAHDTFDLPEESNYLDLLPSLLDVKLPTNPESDSKPSGNKDVQTIGRLTPAQRKAKID